MSEAMEEIRLSLRRLAVAVLAIVVALAELSWLRAILADIGWGPATLGLLVGGVAVAPSLGLAAADGVVGFLLRLLAHDPPAEVLPGLWSDEDSVTTRTAIVVAVRGEPLGPILENLETLLAGLDASRWGDRFAAFVLSETAMLTGSSEVPALEAERLAVAAHPRIGYRRREGGGEPAGILGFLDGLDGFEFAVVLDAGSVMAADAVLRLVRILQARRDLGIVQHLTAGLPATRPFPRLFQFGDRAVMRIRATGQAWWQGDAGSYRGHNAALRIAPLREHGRVPRRADGALPGCEAVSAALLRAAHWGVMMWPDSRGSYEAGPADVLAFERREALGRGRAWPYRRLILGRGLLAMGRLHLLRVLWPGLVAPLTVVMAALAAWLAWRGAVAPGGVALFYVAWLTLHAPKLLGYAELLLRPRARARYGGTAALWRSIAAETAFALLFEAIEPVSRTLALMLGGAVRRRESRPLGVGEGVLRFLPHTVLGALLWAGFLHAGWTAVLVAPFIAGLPLAVPFALLTASPRFGSWLATHGIAAMPEERARP